MFERAELGFQRPLLSINFMFQSNKKGLGEYLLVERLKAESSSILLLEERSWMDPSAPRRVVAVVIRATHLEGSAPLVNGWTVEF